MNKSDPLAGGYIKLSRSRCSKEPPNSSVEKFYLLVNCNIMSQSGFVAFDKLTSGR